MVIIILAALLLLGILFYQAVQGAFSAMITAILSILAAAVALNYFEPLAATMLGAGRLGDYAYALGLLVLFAVPLIALRLLFDRLVPGNVLLGFWPDRVAGAAFGLVTAMILVGVVSLVVQLLPFGPVIGGWRPYKDSLKADQAGPPMWAARFTLGLAGKLSGGSLSPIGSGADFRTVHPDLTREAFCLRNRPTGTRMAAPLDAVRVTDLYAVTKPDPKAPPPADAAAARDRQIDTQGRLLLLDAPLGRGAAPRYPLGGQSGDQIMVVRMKVSELARDLDDWWRLPAGHFKLVAADGRDFYPVGYLTFCGRWRLETASGDPGVADVGRIVIERPWSKAGGPKDLLVDWVYSLPPDARPRAVMFRQAAQASVPPVVDGMPRATDPKSGEPLALDVKPAPRNVAFTDKDVPQNSLLQPKRMELENKLPPDMAIRIITNTPAGADPFELDQGKSLLQRIRFTGPLNNLHPVSQGGTFVRQLAVPKDHDIITVHCEMNAAPTDPDKTKQRERDLGALINAAKPELILDNRRLISHHGAYLIYESNKNKLGVFTYDTDMAKPAGTIDPALVAAWQDNLAAVKAVGFIFIVPSDPDRAAAGLKLTEDPAQEFYPAQPVMLKTR